MVEIEVICIGDELLDGGVVETNAAFLSVQARQTGAIVVGMRIVRDIEEDIAVALEQTSAPVVVVGGGLGPTSDDLTRQAAARFVGTDLELHEPSWQRIVARFQQRGRSVTPNNRSQAMFPTGATVLRSEVGTAPGFSLTVNGRAFYFLPGVPREFRWFAHEYVLPSIPGRPLARRTVCFHGVGESELETKIADSLIDVEVAYRAAYPVIRLTLLGAQAAVEIAIDRIEAAAGEWMIGVDESLSARFGRTLKERQATVTTIESCTAGGIAALITDVSGSSAWFDRGFVTYSNHAKQVAVGVREQTLSAHGAVSAQTVCQMASGGRKSANSTYAIAVSGIAGPTGGTPSKPVGTVFFGFAGPDGTYWMVHRYHGDRAKVRAGTAYTAVLVAMALAQGRDVPYELHGPFDEGQVWTDTGIEVA